MVQVLFFFFFLSSIPLPSKNLPKLPVVSEVERAVYKFGQREAELSSLQQQQGRKDSHPIVHYAL